MADWPNVGWLGLLLLIKMRIGAVPSKCFDPLLPLTMPSGARGYNCRWAPRAWRSGSCASGGCPSAGPAVAGRTSVSTSALFISSCAPGPITRAGALAQKRPEEAREEKGCAEKVLREAVADGLAGCGRWPARDTARAVDQHVNRPARP